MKKLRYCLLYAFIALLCIGLIRALVVLYVSNKTLSILVSKPEFGNLSPDVLKQIIHDLDLNDPILNKSWASYFRHTLELETNLISGHDGIDDLFTLYKKYEWPNRSNYFNDLVGNLAIHQQLMGLSSNDLVKYLGNPDKTMLFRGTNILVYGFNDFNGKGQLAIISMTNGSVVQIVKEVVSNSVQ